MYVCICKGLSKKDIKDQLREGTKTLKDLGRSCGAGTDCGTCRFKLNQMIKEENSEPETPISAPYLTDKN